METKHLSREKPSRIYSRFIIRLGIISFSSLSLFLAVKLSQAHLNASENPAVALKWSKTYSEALFNQSQTYLRHESFSSEDAMRVEAQSKLALKASPLNDESFTNIGFARARMADGNIDRAFFNFALRRNKRNSSALKALIGLDIREGKVAAAIKKTDALIRLGDKDSSTYIRLLAAFSQIGGGREALDSYLKAAPVWGQEYFQHDINALIPENLDAVIKSLDNFTLSHPNSDVSLTLQEQLMVKLLSLGYEEEAYARWVSLPLHKNDLPRDMPYNSDFSQNLAPAPYNWSFQSGPTFYAKVDSAGGLYASFAHDTPQTLAKQHLRLIPGESYTLSSDALWTYKERQGYFTWTLSCLDQIDSFEALALDDAILKTQTPSKTVTIPSTECETQTLRLKAISGLYSKRIWLQTNSISLRLN